MGDMNSSNVCCEDSGRCCWFRYIRDTGSRCHKTPGSTYLVLGVIVCLLLSSVTFVRYAETSDCITYAVNISVTILDKSFGW